MRESCGGRSIIRYGRHPQRSAGLTAQRSGTRALQRLRDFLETIQSTHCFNFTRYAQEIADLPGWYTEHNGELLLAFVEHEPAGCIAFRAVEERTCEIKRLFIAPAFRHQGLARALIAEALARASQHGFDRAVLDTDIVSMAAAYTTYIGFGFREYTPPGSHASSLRFLEREL